MAFCTFSGAPSTHKKDGRKQKSEKYTKSELDQFLPNCKMTRLELFNSLCIQGLMCPTPGKVWVEPFPRWFQSDLTCTYHLGIPGHSIDTCQQFKLRVLSLVNAGWLDAQGFVIKKENQKKGTHIAKDTERPSQGSNPQELKEENLELKEANFRLQMENLKLRKKVRDLEDLIILHRNENQQRLQDLMEEVKSLEEHYISWRDSVDGEGQSESKQDYAGVWDYFKN